MQRLDQLESCQTSPTGNLGFVAVKLRVGTGKCRRDLVPGCSSGFGVSFRVLLRHHSLRPLVHQLAVTGIGFGISVASCRDRLPDTV